MIARFDMQLQKIGPHDDTVGNLVETILGVCDQAAAVIMAAIGIAMKRFLGTDH